MRARPVREGTLPHDDVLRATTSGARAAPLPRDCPREDFMSHGNITRRAFLGRSVAGGAALLTGGFSALIETAAAASSGFPWLEATIPQLQTAMASGQLTSKD